MVPWSKRSSREALLQRTYDDVYASSLQAVLKESSTDYSEAIDEYKRTKDIIVRLLAQLDLDEVKGAQEQSILENILDIERQCDSKISGLRGSYGSSVSSLSLQGSPPPRQPVGRVAVGSKPGPPVPPPSRVPIQPPLYPPPNQPYNQPPLYPQQPHSQPPSHPPSHPPNQQAKATQVRALAGAARSQPQLSRPRKSAAMADREYTLRTSKPKKGANSANRAASVAWDKPRSSEDSDRDLMVRTAAHAVSARQPQGHLRSYSHEHLRRSPKLDEISRFAGFDATFDEPNQPANQKQPSPPDSKQPQSKHPQSKHPKAPTPPPTAPSVGIGPHQVREQAIAIAQEKAKEIQQQNAAMVAAQQMQQQQAAQIKKRPVNRYVVSGTRPRGLAEPKASHSPHASLSKVQARAQAQAQAKSKGESEPVSPVSPEQEPDEWDLVARQKIKELRGVDENAALQILSEVVLKGDPVHWTDIAGLEKAKASLKETVVYPFLRPDLFSGLREPALGMLLFGPPGTGKTMLARAVATESRSTFFSISASSLTSKYMGESEKLVRALFEMAKALAPSIIFVDEIDSILTQRSDAGEHETSRRIKTEFLVHWSDLQAAAANSSENDRRVLVLGATNMPWAIDEAARRRFVRRQYIPLPEPETRKIHLEKLLSHQKHALSPENVDELVVLTDGFSGSDMTALAKDAAMGPLRALGDAILTTNFDEVRPISFQDFQDSMQTIKASVSQEGLQAFEQWATLYGSSGA